MLISKDDKQSCKTASISKDDQQICQTTSISKDDKQIGLAPSLVSLHFKKTLFRYHNCTYSNTS